MSTIIGHRGAISFAPENTLSSINAIKDINCEWIEVDVTLSKDNIPIIFHDKGLDRCTNLKGNVSDYTLDELKKADIIYKNIKERIPTLSDFLVSCNNLLINIFIELKYYNDEKKLEIEVIKILNDLNLSEIQIILCSYNRNIIKVLNDLSHNYRKSLIVDKIPTDWEEFIKINNVYSLNLDPKLNNMDLIKYCAAIIPCYCHVINDMQEFIKLNSIGVKGIITDVPEIFKN